VRTNWMNIPYGVGVLWSRCEAARWSHLVVRQPGPISAVASADLSTVAFQVPDMDCPTCTVALSAGFRKLPGVVDPKLDVDGRKAVVTFDSKRGERRRFEEGHYRCWFPHRHGSVS